MGELDDGVLGPRESGQFIAKNSAEIAMDEGGVKRVAQMIHESVREGEFHQSDFNAHDVHIKTDSVSEAIDWIFFIDTINFSFWSNDFVVTHKGQTYTGYFAACACVNRALAEGIPITSASFMSDVSEGQLSSIFRTDSGTTIPLLKERVSVIREAGQVLLEKYSGTFFNCVKECGKSAENLLRIIVQNFDSYRDYAKFQGQKVSFLKRAQILVSDVHSCLHERSEMANFFDIEKLTMFADYRVPQVLAFLGVLRYSPALWKALNETELFENGSEREVILRGFSIYACDKITEEVEFLRSEYLRQNGGTLRKLFAVDVDMFLWIHRRKIQKEIEAAKIPFHRLRCIYY